MKIHLFLFYLLLCFIVSSCIDRTPVTPKPTPVPEPQLPPATQEGKNTIGCLVNGEVRLPKSPGFPTVSHAVSLHQGKFNLYFIYADEDKNIQDDFIISFGKPIIIASGDYILQDYPEEGASFKKRIDTCYYFTDTANTGKLTIAKLDAVNRIIAGTFEMTFVNGKCDTVRITEGRFDMKY